MIKIFLMYLAYIFFVTAVSAWLVHRAKKVHPFKIIIFLIIVMLLPLTGVYFFTTQPTTQDDAVVPSIIGLSSQEADHLLAKASLSPSQSGSAYADNLPSGSVLSQWPEAGVKVKVGRLVTYVVAIGSIPVKVPDLTDLSFDQAEKIILAKGLLIGNVQQEGATGDPEIIQDYKILSQSPSPESVVKSGSYVDLVIEKKKDQPQGD